MLIYARMNSVTRLLRFVLPFALLAGAAGGTPPHGALAARSAAGASPLFSATDAGPRYSSAAYGYSLQIPSGWARVPHVRWTPLGPRADLTLMPPDHQAALGVLVVPTGKTVYSAVDLQNVALRLIAQESPLPTVAVLEGYGRISKEIIKAMVVHHITYQTAAATLTYGGHMVCSALMSVAVTQQHHRLYVVAAVVYQAIFGQPPAGSATDTPTPGGFGRAPAAVSTVLPAGPRPAPISGHAGTVPATRRLGDAPAPLPTDRERGNLCRSAGDAGLIFLDKNCRAGAYFNAMLHAFASMTIAAHATNDTRPAAVVGADGFATFTDAALGVTVRYPAQWRPVSLQGAVAAAQSPDQTAVVDLAVQSTGAATFSSARLQSIADQQIAQVGSVVLAPTHQSLRVNGAPALLALASGVGINTGSMVGQVQVSVLVVAAHRRLYVLRGATLTVRSGIGDTTPVLYPYFTPFTALARRAVFDFEAATGPLFTHQLELGLAFATVLSLDLTTPHA